MRRVAPALISLLFTLLAPTTGFAEDDADLAKTLGGLKLRSLGPALMGGRIADIAVSPRDYGTWYLAVGSGGVWKTENAGITWQPVFDDQPSYSIGCVTLDPSNPDVVWVGTGENVSGRHVGWGDGVYRSLDGGKTWERMGLERSEHISEIIVDPRDGDVVFVAAEGPLWSSGGERGLYKTTDGGATWDRVLEVDDDTGVTDVEFDPRDPDVLYAASYQRRRHIWSLLAGGPGSGIHKSTDAGKTWRRLERGLPKGDMGKIGLALSPADPDVVYATIEAADDEKGFYRSQDRGESWQRGADYISNGTGPHYYQEIVASPHDVDVVYQMDVFLHVTRDGGKSFDYLETGHDKHSDSHAMWIDPENADHLLAGTDGGLYESFDDGATWRHFPNLPVSQFYKLALSDDEPFYSILGGAQDLGTLLGPVRTANVEGVSNRDWTVPLGADGYACAFDPENPDIAYMEWQVGNLQRLDRPSGELHDIKPQPAPGDPPERWNWDAPLIVSPHSASRLYFGSQRLWRSDDRGDSWTAVSGDLTRGSNRYELEVMDRVQSVDALYDNGAMSMYATLTAVSESPVEEGLLYTGSDDGLIQVRESGGDEWRTAATPPGVPERAFVNDVAASLHDAGTVFVAFDAHKVGDFRPLLFASDDRGQTWRSIAGDSDGDGLPEGHVVWSIVQDHVDSDLLFAGTEFGLFFTLDGGGRWIELSAGVPTIAFRDVAIQRRENDLVGATFGRGFYVLDDYSPLREVAKGALEQDAAVFPIRDAWWYVPSVPMQARGKPSQGSDDFTAPNPPFGAVFTYYLKTAPKTAKATRQEDEKKLAESGEDAPFPGWDRLRQEALEDEPKALLIVRDGEGKAVRRLEAPATAGVHRVAWDLRRPAPDPVNLTPPGFQPPWVQPPQGPLAPPGTYRVELAMLAGGKLETLTEPREFHVRPLPGSASTDFDRVDFGAIAAFQQETAELLRQGQGAAAELESAANRIRHMKRALFETPAAAPELFTRLEDLEAGIAELRLRLVGDNVKRRWNEPSVPSVLGRLGRVTFHWDTRQPPTTTQRRGVEIARSELAGVGEQLRRMIETAIPALEAELEAAGAPWTPGRQVPGGDQ